MGVVCGGSGGGPQSLARTVGCWEGFLVAEVGGATEAEGCRVTSSALKPQRMGHGIWNSHRSAEGTGSRVSLNTGSTDVECKGKSVSHCRNRNIQS